jgi:hypothetical protein
MDRIATGIVIAATALLMSGGLMRDVMAADSGARVPDTEIIKSQGPVAYGPSSERVMSLILTLEALRAAPALLDARKV